MTPKSTTLVHREYKRLATAQQCMCALDPRGRTNVDVYAASAIALTMTWFLYAVTRDVKVQVATGSFGGSGSALLTTIQRYAPDKWELWGANGDASATTPIAVALAAWGHNG